MVGGPLNGSRIGFDTILERDNRKEKEREKRETESVRLMNSNIIIPNCF